MTKWENAWMTLAIIAATMLLSVICCVILSSKKAERYSLSSDEDTNVPVIIKEIDWWEDEKIYLDRYTTDLQAVRILDSLNSNLAKYEKQ